MLFPYQGAVTQTDIINAHIALNGSKVLSDLQIMAKEIANFKVSRTRQWMLLGDQYYEGNHDILRRKRMVIGQDGEQVEAKNLVNNKRVDNQYAKLVDQKVNYLLAKPLTIETENNQYAEALNMVFNKRFHRSLKNIGQYSINNGIAWLHPYYNALGKLAFRIFPGYEIIPFWLDADKTILDFAVRLYPEVVYEKDERKIVERVEVYTLEGIKRYAYSDNKLVPDVEQGDSNYIAITDTQGNKQEYNWQRIPLIAFRYNEREFPLVRAVKNLQDAYNKIISNFENNMDEDTHSTVIVLENYDGQNLGEFRHNLAKFGAVKVRSFNGERGDVRTLEIKVNKDNYESILTIFKKAIIENGRGYDAKDDRMSNNPNQMNIQSMYADIDLDANDIETEYQAAFEELLWFVNRHLEHLKLPNFDNNAVNIIFNRDMLINEKDVVEALEKSVYLSLETRIAQHPYVKDVQLELKRIKKEQQEQMELYDNYDQTFQQLNGGGKDGQE